MNPRIMRPNEVSRIPRLNAAERASISQARLLLRFEGQRLGVIRERSQDSTSATITSCQMLHSAGKLEDLRIPPANRLEELRRDRAGQHSIRINDQFCVCFVWRDGDAFDVEITDYH